MCNPVSKPHIPGAKDPNAIEGRYENTSGENNQKGFIPPVNRSPTWKGRGMCNKTFLQKEVDETAASLIEKTLIGKNCWLIEWLKFRD